jgi:hypothetical protein
MELKGVAALRLGYIYDGTPESSSRIPPIEIFTKEKYKG